MVTGHLHVVLEMETSLLTSALQQCLAGNEGLAIEVRPPGGRLEGLGEPCRSDGARTVQIGLLEDPVRFTVAADGRERVLECQGLDELVRVLANLGYADPAARNRA